MNTKLEALATSTVEVAIGKLKAGEQVNTVLIAETKNNEGIIAPLMFPPDCSGDQKDRMLAVLSEALKSFGAVRYVVVSEAWFTLHDGTDQWDGLAPSKSDRRQECLVIIGQSDDGDEVHRFYEIERTPDTVSAVLKTGDDLRMESRFLGLL